MIGVANDNLWRKFCSVAGLEAIVNDPKFKTNADRVAHRAETLGHVQTALAKRPVAYWNDELARIGVPCSPINSLGQLLAHPHTAASGMILDYQHPLAGPTRASGNRSCWTTSHAVPESRRRRLASTPTRSLPSLG
jgi:crotonobetainyl-CoA:carnitine CoA-transferase CaiB-like acyl-CoA transferase